MLWSRRSLKWISIGAVSVLGAASALLAWQVARIVNMPGGSYSGKPPALSADETALRERFRGHVRKLAGEIGRRNFRHPEAQRRAAEYLLAQLREQGYAPTTQRFTISGVDHANIIAEIRGAAAPNEIIVIGAHYDTVTDSPGANDNGSGVAALLEIARHCAGKPFPRTLRFAFFVNEEGHSPGPSGSLLYARRCRERNERILGMISLETLGFYTDAPGSQRYPFPVGPLYPSTGDFIAFVGDSASRDFIHQSIGAFRAHASFPSRGIVAPEWMRDVARSDHAAFWAQGYPGLMVTDTANFRYPYYHSPKDTPDKLNYDAVARVTAGLARAAEALAGAPPSAL